MHDELVWDRTKGICQIEEGDVHCFLLRPNILDCFLHDHIVFKATTYVGKERLLDCAVDNFIFQEVGCESPGEDKVE